MAFIPAPNTVRLCLQFVWASQTVEICMAFLKNAAVTDPDMAALTAAMEAWRQSDLRTVQSAEITANQWVATLLTTATSSVLITPITVNRIGTVAGISVSNNVTLATTFQTALRGRSYRGRAYTPGLPQSQVLDSLSFSSAFVANVTSAYAAIPAALPVGWTHVVASYQNNNVARSTAARTPVTAYRTETNIDSQRRRLFGRGA